MDGLKEFVIRCKWLLLALFATLLVAITVIIVLVLAYTGNKSGEKPNGYVTVSCTQPRSLGCQKKVDSLQLQESQEQVFVNRSLIVLISSAVPKERRQGVLNTIKIADLVAARKHDRYNAARSYNQEFKAVFSNLGWLITNSETTSQTSTTRMNIGDAISNDFSGVVKRRVYNALNALNGDDNVCGWKVFSCGSCAGAQNVWLFVVSYDSGTVTAFMSGYVFKFESCGSNWLQQEVVAEYTHSLEIVRINRGIENRTTDGVSEKLGTAAYEWFELKGI